MSKLFHCVYMLLWSQALVLCLIKVESGDFGLLHIAGLVFASVCAGAQILDLLLEIVEGE